jgi:hypothetical protein
MDGLSLLGRPSRVAFSSCRHRIVTLAQPVVTFQRMCPFGPLQLAYREKREGKRRGGANGAEQASSSEHGIIRQSQRAKKYDALPPEYVVKSLMTELPDGATCLEYSMENKRRKEWSVRQQQPQIGALRCTLFYYNPRNGLKDLRRTKSLSLSLCVYVRALLFYSPVSLWPPLPSRIHSTPFKKWTARAAPFGALLIIQKLLLGSPAHGTRGAVVIESPDPGLSNRTQESTRRRPAHLSTHLEHDASTSLPLRQHEVPPGKAGEQGEGSAPAVGMRTAA